MFQHIREFNSGLDQILRIPSVKARLRIADEFLMENNMVTTADIFGPESFQARDTYISHLQTELEGRFDILPIRVAESVTVGLGRYLEWKHKRRIMGIESRANRRVSSLNQKASSGIEKIEKMCSCATVDPSKFQESIMQHREDYLKRRQQTVSNFERIAQDCDSFISDNLGKGINSVIDGFQWVLTSAIRVTWMLICRATKKLLGFAESIVDFIKNRKGG